MANAGDTVKASDNTRFYTKATQGVAQSIPNNSWTAITLDDTDTVDSLGLHDPVSSNTRLTIGLKLGWWLVIGKYTSVADTRGATRGARILLNGVGVNGGYQRFPDFNTTASQVTTGGFWSVETTTLVQSTVSTDYIELHAMQNSGTAGAVNTSVSGDFRCQLIALYLGS